MHSATTATGRPLPGKSLPKNRPAPLTSSAPRHPVAPKPRVTSRLQCYIPALIDNDRQIHAKINRQQFATSKITRPSISNRRNQHVTPAFAGRSSLITRHCRSNRHTPRLENAISHRKQTLDTLSNRHFSHVSASHQPRITDANRPPQVASNIVSNRQWQLLENAVNLSRQTIAPRSDRHKNALFASPVSGVRWTPPESCHRTRMGSRDAFPASPTMPRNTGHESRIAAHHSPIPRLFGQWYIRSVPKLPGAATNGRPKTSIRFRRRSPRRNPRRTHDRPGGRRRP
jgi:hypothetical protein